MAALDTRKKVIPSVAVKNMKRHRRKEVFGCNLEDIEKDGASLQRIGHDLVAEMCKEKHSQRCHNQKKQLPAPESPASSIILEAEPGRHHEQNRVKAADKHLDQRIIGVERIISGHPLSRGSEYYGK